MDTKPANLLAALQTLEAEGTLDLNRVTSLLDQVDDNSPGLTDPEKMMISAERMAFRFAADSDFAEANWKTYYGPFAIINVGENKVKISPSIDRVTPEMLEYWEKRATETPHPVLRARYADLVWDFSKKVTGKPAKISIAHIAIDAGLDAVSGNRCKNFLTVWPLLKRSLIQALSLSQAERAKKAIAIAIDYDETQSQPGSRNAWGHSFDILFGTKGVKLTQEQTLRIISGLETSLAASVKPDENGVFGDPFAAKSATQRLVTYYQKQKKPDEVARVVSLFGQGVIDAANDANELMGSAWLKDAFDIATLAGAKETTDKLAIALKDKSFNIKEKGKTISWDSSIDPTLLEQFLEEMVDGEENTVVRRIVIHYVPHWEQTKEQVLKIAQTCVFTSLIKHTIVDQTGREIATIGSVEEDLDGRTIHQMAKSMNYIAPYLNLVFQRWIDKFAVTPERLCDKLLSCPVFTPESKTALTRGIRAYFEKDHTTVVHVLIPQIESAFREFLIVGGVNIYRQNRLGGIDYRTLGDMLSDDLVKTYFGENGQHYFQVLLNDHRGWNIRNTVCHGLVDASAYNQPQSDRVLHVLLLLSLLTLAKTQESESTPNEHDKPPTP